MFTTSFVAVGMVFLRSYSAFFPLQTRKVELMPNSLILVSSDHITFSQSSLESFTCSLANFRQPCTCASLSRGTLRALQDFKPWRSVLPMVTEVPAALRSFTSSPCVVLGLSRTVWRIIDCARGEILHGAPDRGQLTVVWCCFHLLIITPTVVCFSPSCLPMVLSPIHALCRRSEEHTSELQ